MTKPPLGISIPTSSELLAALLKDAELFGPGGKGTMHIPEGMFRRLTLDHFAVFTFRFPNIKLAAVKPYQETGR